LLHINSKLYTNQIHEMTSHSSISPKNHSGIDHSRSDIPSSENHSNSCEQRSPELVRTLTASHPEFFAIPVLILRSGIDQYRLQIQDREYTAWSFLDPATSAPKPLTESESLINPATLKLFDNDLVDLSTPIPTIIHSHTKSALIPGVLILDGNQTYGRTVNQKRLLYKCIPDNLHLPSFLVPYQPDIKFTKTQKNRYVVFRFDNWDSKYPHGILVENLGTVDELPAFYEYQLYCRQIHHRITDFTAAVKKITKNLTNPTPEQQAIKSRFFQPVSPTYRQHRIFSIDPEGAKDIDDAVSITMDSPFVATIRIYIANVYAWMETLNLWSAFGDRVSTIYLPDSRCPMLPTVLSESVCSLVADGSPKLVFCMEFRFDLNNNFVIPDSTKFLNLSVKVERNYVYESKSLLQDSDYKLLFKCAKMMEPNIEDSHDVVAHLMVMMNTICGQRLNKTNAGIFRENMTNREEDPEIPFAEISLNSRTLLKNWKNQSGKYISSTQNANPYVHITSPIRRLVDLLNLIAFQREFGLVEEVSREATDFLNKWQSNLGEINRRMKSARKVQMDCELLHRCTAHPEWMQHPHRGVIFERVERHDGTYSYMVHLSELNVLGRIVSAEKYVNYSSLEFRLFVFQDADKIRRKIRLAIT